MVSLSVNWIIIMLKHCIDLFNFFINLLCQISVLILTILEVKYYSFFICRFEALYAKSLPESIVGEAFLEQHENHNDPVTIIDQKRTYVVKAPTTHPIYENFRVKVRTSLKH